MIFSYVSIERQGYQKNAFFTEKPHLGTQKLFQNKETSRILFFHKSILIKIHDEF